MRGLTRALHRRKARQVQKGKIDNLTSDLLPLFSDLCGLGVFARDIPNFGCGVAALGSLRLNYPKRDGYTRPLLCDLCTTMWLNLFALVAALPP